MNWHLLLVSLLNCDECLVGIAQEVGKGLRVHGGVLSCRDDALQQLRKLLHMRL